MFLNKLLIALSFIVSVSSAYACDELAWTINGKKEGICYHAKYEAMVSSRCVEKKCGAIEFLEKVKGLQLPAETVQNPGSRYCKFVNGTVVMGANDRGTQNAFCQAKDGSLVDLSALGLQAKKQ